MTAKLARALVATALLVAVAGAPALAQDRSANSITDIRQETTDRSTRLILESSGPLAYTYYSPDPLTLVVDIPDVDSSRLPSRLNVGTREVEALRVTQLARGDGRSLTRVEVRLASLTPYQIYSRDRTLNLVFERPGQVAQAVTAPAPQPVAPAEVLPEAPDSAAEATAPEIQAEPAPVPLAEQRPAPAHVEPPAPVAKTAAVEPQRPAVRATRILDVETLEEAGQLAFTVHADGTLQYQDFFLGNPDRLVVDFRDVVAGSARRIPVDQEPVKAVRLAQFSAADPRVARLVLDLSERQPYRIVEGTDGVRIVFGEGRSPQPAPLAALKVDPREETSTEPAVFTPAAPQPALMPAPFLEPVQEPEPAMAAEPEPALGEKKWGGHPISLDFKDGDLQDIFRLFADISGLNVVVNPGISGRVTLKLTEVPWDQALDLILKINGLGYAIEDNVLRIARMSDMQKEEADRRKLAEEKALAGDLVDWSRRIYYAKAAELSNVLKQAGAISPRGQVNVDTRTNTLLMKDLPQYVETARALIENLDIATPQVEIEARIVVTTRNFTRDLGIQWGFNQIQSPAYGNTTNQAFPNSIIVNGSGVPSTGGLSPDLVGGPDQGIGLTGRGYAVNLPASGFNSALGISMGNILGNFNLDLALTALERQGRGRLLSTPKITTQNNQAAEIKQGVQIPIQTVANNTVTVSFQDAALTLKVTPQISEAGTVILDVDLKNDSPDFARSVNGIPPINTQSAKTQVLVRDGTTTVIGGIYQSQEQAAQQRTPFLSKIPILGYLFRNKFVLEENSELLLFLTPRIVKG
jgi:type IV pilus secretin PilQ/predicted competence protein